MGVITDLKKHVFAGEQLGKESVLPLCDAPLEELCSAADEIRRHYGPW